MHGTRPTFLLTNRFIEKSFFFVNPSQLIIITCQIYIDNLFFSLIHIFSVTLFDFLLKNIFLFLIFPLKFFPVFYSLSCFLKEREQHKKKFVMIFLFLSLKLTLETMRVFFSEREKQRRNKKWNDYLDDKKECLCIHSDDVDDEVEKIYKWSCCCFYKLCIVFIIKNI